jgi:hypothetical protein
MYSCTCPLEIARVEMTPGLPGHSTEASNVPLAGAQIRICDDSPVRQPQIAMDETGGGIRQRFRF